MSCILRISGENLNVDEMMESIDLPFEKPFRRGELKSKHMPDLGEHSKSGCMLVVSADDSLDVMDQEAEVEIFLEKHAEAINTLCNFSEVDSLTLDFAVFLLPDIMSKCIGLKSDLIKSLAQTRIDVEFSVYRTAIN